MTALARLLLLALLSFGVCVQVGLAQGRPQAKKPEYKDVTVDGTVKGIQGNVLQMEAAAGYPYSVLIIPRESKLGLSGTAKPDFLKPGMMVSFYTGTLPKEKKAEVETPPTELKIISPSETNKPRVYEDKDKPDSVFICGTVGSYREEKLTVSAAGRQVVVPVPADMEIKVDSSDPTYIRVGDSIKVMGKEVQPYKSEGNKIQEGQIVGQTVDIKLQDTLSAATFKKKK